MRLVALEANRIELAFSYWREKSGTEELVAVGRQGVASEFAAVDEQWLYPTSTLLPDDQAAAMALVGMSSAGKAMDETERKRAADAIVSESETVRGRYTDGSELAFELSTNLAIAKA
jgi:hypothetical protein